MLFRWGVPAVAAVGIGTRLAALLADRSFWCDESMLAYNIMERSWAGLLEPLALSQAAPPGFLLLTKAACGVFGYTEIVFRLLPFLAGIAALPLMYVVAKKVGGRWCGLLGLGLLAVNGPAVFHASEFKPYSTDLTLALAVALVFLTWVENELAVRRMWPVILLVMVAVWTSFPGVFVISGAVGALVLESLLRKQWLRLVRSGLVLLWGGLHFLLQYWLVLRPAMGNEYLRG
jgi:uncharacterized membrane protein